MQGSEFRNFVLLSNKTVISEEQKSLSVIIDKNAFNLNCDFSLSVNFANFIKANFFKNCCPSKQEKIRYNFSS